MADTHKLLQIRKCPTDLLARINAMAELSGVSREQFVIECLDDATKELKPIQEKRKQARKRQ
jgi:hypothetical protein